MRVAMPERRLIGVHKYDKEPSVSAQRVRTAVLPTRRTQMDTDHDRWSGRAGDTTQLKFGLPSEHLCIETRHRCSNARTKPKALEVSLLRSTAPSRNFDVCALPRPQFRPTAQFCACTPSMENQASANVNVDPRRKSLELENVQPLKTSFLHWKDMKASLPPPKWPSSHQPPSEPVAQLPPKPSSSTDLALSQAEYDDNYDLEELYDAEKDASKGPQESAREDWRRILYVLQGNCRASSSANLPQILDSNLGDSSAFKQAVDDYRALALHYWNAHPTDFSLALTIALRAFVVLGLAYVLALYTAEEPRAEENILWNYLQGSRRGSTWPVATWLAMFPAALMAAVSLPMFMMGVLHMPSLPVLVMLFPLAHATEALLSFITCSVIGARFWLPMSALAVIAALAVVLRDEYRLLVQGLIWGPVSIISMGLSRGFFRIASECIGLQWSTATRRGAFHGFAIMTIILGIFSSGIMAYFYEPGPDPTVEHPALSASTLILMIINTAAIVCTAFTGTFLLAYSPLSYDSATVGFSSMPLPVSEFLASTLASQISYIIAIFAAPTVLVSWVQVAAYSVAIVFLGGPCSLYKSFGTISCPQRRDISNPGSSGYTKLREASRPRKVIMLASLFIVINFWTYFLTSVAEAPIAMLANQVAPSLDLAYQPKTRIEIVLSMYDESPESVANLIHDIESTTYISSFPKQDVKTTVYTKHPTDNLEELKSLTKAGSVIRLANVGREGGTYLRHIVHNWDELAEQTLFIQAGPHNKREIIPRIESYLGANTGMLSLGEAGAVCDCLTCSDRWGWSDSFHVIPSLYSRVHPGKEVCTPETQITISLKGQFIASGRRIRGISKDIYREMLEAIESEVGWSHDPQIVGSKGDTADNPFFGFTVERLWGLLLQCADPQIGAKCPSLLSGTLGFRRGGGIEDCACLD
ncbi:hypothetical protein BP6252_07744 [Coleophoma cylindrospora]|uniref:Uncharacterized protein n=1 Tax=Coleophoma cylindrospora TaxID=1849047 RepID=A0A3D8RBC3_9HELO|nr:hypothetical protein BP6252_07744 [Coleophoma cylindrospora]